MPFAEHLEAILDDVAKDADALGCAPEVARTREIAADGTSADRQLAIFAEARASGSNTATALAAVVDWMAQATAGQVRAGSRPARVPTPRSCAKELKAG